jgi:hypothetical protein
VDIFQYPMNSKNNPRDLAIDSAAYRIITMLEPTISHAEIQKLGQMEIYADGYYFMLLDGKRFCQVTLEGEDTFTMKLLLTNSTPQ